MPLLLSWVIADTLFASWSLTQSVIICCTIEGSMLLPILWSWPKVSTDILLVMEVFEGLSLLIRAWRALRSSPLFNLFAWGFVCGERLGCPGEFFGSNCLGHTQSLCKCLWLLWLLLLLFSNGGRGLLEGVNIEIFDRVSSFIYGIEAGEVVNILEFVEEVYSLDWACLVKVTGADWQIPLLDNIHGVSIIRSVAFGDDPTWIRDLIYVVNYQLFLYFRMIWCIYGSLRSVGINDIMCLS